MRITCALLSEMAQAVRVNLTDASSAELTGLIRAAAADLQRQGVQVIDLDDPLTKQAVKLYCKANYGYDDDSEKFRRCYEALSASMALDLTDYKEGGDSGE